MSGGEAFVTETLLQLIIILIAAEAVGAVFLKLGQSRVLGELLIGLLLGPSLLGLVDINNEILKFLAELAIIVLLFHVGLESDLHELLKSGYCSVMAGILGIMLPLLLTMLYITSFTEFNIAIAFFIGATLTATSITITIRVLKEMGKLDTKETRIILGAAIIDDILGLILLSLIVDIASSGTIVFSIILDKLLIAVGFFTTILFITKIYEKNILDIVKRHESDSTFIVLAFTFALMMSYFSAGIGLATIVGAFAAGLMLENKESTKIIEKRTLALNEIFGPVFFILAGAAVDFRAIISIELLPFIIVLTLIASIGKIASGIGACKAKASQVIVGVGMLPRGEVGLIFAKFGLINLIIGSDIYSALVAVIMITTFITPMLLKLNKTRFYEQ